MNEPEEQNDEEIAAPQEPPPVQEWREEPSAPDVLGDVVLDEGDDLELAPDPNTDEPLQDNPLPPHSEGTVTLDANWISPNNWVTGVLSSFVGGAARGNALVTLFDGTAAPTGLTLNLGDIIDVIVERWDDTSHRWFCHAVNIWQNPAGAGVCILLDGAQHTDTHGPPNSIALHGSIVRGNTFAGPVDKWERYDSTENLMGDVLTLDNALLPVWQSLPATGYDTGARFVTVDRWIRCPVNKSNTKRYIDGDLGPPHANFIDWRGRQFMVMVQLYVGLEGGTPPPANAHTAQWTGGFIFNCFRFGDAFDLVNNLDAAFASFVLVGGSPPAVYFGLNLETGTGAIYAYVLNGGAQTVEFQAHVTIVGFEKQKTAPDIIIM